MRKKKKIHSSFKIDLLDFTSRPRNSKSKEGSVCATGASKELSMVLNANSFQILAHSFHPDLFLDKDQTNSIHYIH